MPNTPLHQVGTVPEVSDRPGASYRMIGRRPVCNGSVGKLIPWCMGTRAAHPAATLNPIPDAKYTTSSGWHRAGGVS